MKQPFKRVISYALAGLLSVGLLGQTNVVSVGAVTYTASQLEQLRVVQEDKMIPGTIKTEGAFDSSYLSVGGYAASAGVGDRSQYKQGDAEYALVKTPGEFLSALTKAKMGRIKVIEIGADLDLGYLALTDSEREYDCIKAYTDSETTAGCSFTNPDLMKSGISILEISNTTGLTIFSTEGYSISHAEIKLQASCKDIVIRNLRFEGMWEWDDWQMNGNGGFGTHKRTGWSTFKINGADNVWLDHCDFGIAFDGCLDISGTLEADGCEGISITWCTFGKESTEPGSMVYNTMEYLESVYQESKVNPDVNSFTIYGILRDNGWTQEECMIYGNFHSKCHLTGDGDKDYDKNPLTRYTLAYNQYYNMQQRVPMVRQGSVHMYNCYLDYTSRLALTDRITNDLAKDADGNQIYYKKIKDMNGNDAITYYTEDDEAKGVEKYAATLRNAIEMAGGSAWVLYRAIDARNGASIAADTCVYYGVKPITGSERNLDIAYDFGYNHALIVNSSVTDYDISTGGPGEIYVGSSWDNDGDNKFLESQGYWINKSTIGNWTWKELSNNDEYDQYIKLKDDTLPYEYQTVPLEDVEETVKTNGGCGVLKMSAEDWLKNSYDESYVIQYAEEGKDEVTGITLDEEETILFTSERLQLYADVTPATAADKTVTWTSSDETIAKVGQGGLVTPLKNGEVTITAETENGKSASCKVTVKTLPVRISLIGEVPSTIYVGDVYPLAVEVSDENTTDKTVSWESSVPTRLSVENGRLEALKSGSVTFRVVSNMSGNMIWNTPLSIQKDIKINACTVPTTGVALDVTEASVSTEVSGDSVTLQATVLPTNSTNKKLRWESSDETVAIVEDGVVTPVSTGEAVITVTTINGAKTAECRITVTDEAEQPTPPEPSIDEYKKGDVDNNTEIDSDDAVLVLKHFAGLEELTGAALEAADVDGNGDVDSDDAVWILRYFAGLIDDDEWAEIGKRNE